MTKCYRPKLAWASCGRTESWLSLGVLAFNPSLLRDGVLVQNQPGMLTVLSDTWAFGWNFRSKLLSCQNKTTWLCSKQYLGHVAEASTGASNVTQWQSPLPSMPEDLGSKLWFLWYLYTIKGCRCCNFKKKQKQTNKTRTCEMAQWLRALATKPDELHESLESIWHYGRVDSHRLSSDLHTCAWNIHTYIHWLKKKKDQKKS